MITVGYKVDMGRAGNPADERGRRGGERGDGVALSVELGDGGFELGHRDVRMRAAQRNTTQHQTPFELRLLDCGTRVVYTVAHW